MLKTTEATGLMGLVTAIPKLITGLISLTAEFGFAKVKVMGFKGVLDTLNINPVMLAISALIAVVAGGVAIFNAVTTSTEEWRQKLSDSKSALSEAQQEATTLNEQLKTTQDRIDELNGKDKLTLTEEGELERLKKQNAELKKKIELTEIANKQAQQTVYEDFVNTMSSDVNDNYATFNQYSSLADYGSTSAQEALKSDRVVKEKEYIQMNFEALSALKDKLYKASTNEEKQQIEKQIDEIEKYLSSKQKDFTNASKDISYIAKPTTENEKNTNAWLDFIDDFNNKVLIEMGDTGSINTVWENLWTSDKYKDAAKALQELADKGKITSKNIKELMQSNPKVKEFIDKLKELGLIKTDNLDTIANQIKSIGNAVDSATSSVELESLSTIYDEVKEKAQLVEQAQKEMSDSGIVSTETMVKLVEQGIATEDQFTKTAKGYTISKNALENLNKVAMQSYQNDLNNAKVAANAVIEAEGGKTLAITATTNAYIKQLEALKAQKYNKTYYEVYDKVGGGYGGAIANGSATKAAENVTKDLDNQINSLKNAQKKIDLFDTTRIETINSGSGSGSSSKETAGDKALKRWEAKKKEWKHNLEMGQITQDTYEKTLKNNYKKYLGNYSETLDERRAIEEEWYKWQITKAQNTWNEQNSAKKHALEMGQITEKQYYDWVKKNYKKILGNYKDTLDERRSLEEDYYKWQKEQTTKQLNLTKTKLDGAKAAVDDLLDSQKEKLEEQKSSIEEYYNTEIDKIQEKIDKLQDANDAKEEEINLAEKAEALAKARNNRTILTYDREKGWVYTNSKQNVKDAKKDYDDAKFDAQIKSLEDQIDNLEKKRDEATDAIDKQIESYDKYKQLWSDVVDAQEKAQNKMYANSMNWANWEQKILQGNLDLLKDFSKQYTEISKKLDKDSLANNNSDLTSSQIDKKYKLVPSIINSSDFKKAIEGINDTQLKEVVRKATTDMTKSASAQQVSNNTLNKSVVLSIGDIIIQDTVGDANGLARSIVKNLPNSLLRELNK